MKIELLGASGGIAAASEICFQCIRESSAEFLIPLHQPLDAV